MHRKTTISGFTLVELVAVIVLIGILAVTLAPRYLGKGGFAEYAVRDQIIAGARMAQQRAMYNHDRCYRLEVDSGVIAVQNRVVGSGAVYENIGPDEGWQNGINIESGVSVNDITVYFDGLGNALGNTLDCAGSSLSEITIPVLGETTVNVCINGVGYVRAC